LLLRAQRGERKGKRDGFGEEESEERTTMDIPVPKTVSNITDNTTDQQCQERKVGVGSREHVSLQIDDRE